MNLIKNLLIVSAGLSFSLLTIASEKGASLAFSSALPQGAEFRFSQQRDERKHDRHERLFEDSIPSISTAAAGSAFQGEFAFSSDDDNDEELKTSDRMKRNSQNLSRSGALTPTASEQIFAQRAREEERKLTQHLHSSSSSPERYDYPSWEFAELDNVSDIEELPRERRHVNVAYDFDDEPSFATPNMPSSQPPRVSRCSKIFTPLQSAALYLASFPTAWVRFHVENLRRTKRDISNAAMDSAASIGNAIAQPIQAAVVTADETARRRIRKARREAERFAETQRTVLIREGTDQFGRMGAELIALGKKTGDQLVQASTKKSMELIKFAKAGGTELISHGAKQTRKEIKKSMFRYVFPTAGAILLAFGLLYRFRDRLKTMQTPNKATLHEQMAKLHKMMNKLMKQTQRPAAVPQLTVI